MSSIVNISIDSIEFSDSVTLKDVNIKVKGGEFVYLIGKTGSGKSSLLRIIYGDIAVENCKAKAVGFDLTNIKEDEIPFLRRKLGIVFQDFQLLPDRTVFENLRFVLRATQWDNEQEIKQRVDEVLLSVSLADKGDKYPFQLSGGEQQRVAIARALLNKPELIVADEPTGNLDPASSAEILQLLIKVSKQYNTAVIMATHDYQMILKYPARTIKIDGGTLFNVEHKKQ